VVQDIHGGRKERKKERKRIENTNIYTEIKQNQKAR
jgi:hypothetical protein